MSTLDHLPLLTNCDNFICKQFLNYCCEQCAVNDYFFDIFDMFMNFFLKRKGRQFSKNNLYCDWHTFTFSLPSSGHYLIFISSLGGHTAGDNIFPP